MNLSKEQLDELEDLAYHLIDISIMAVMLEIPELTLRELVSDKTSEAYAAYFRGYGRQVVEQRKALIRSAQNGSNPSQEQLAKILLRFSADMPKPFAV